MPFLTKKKCLQNDEDVKKVISLFIPEWNLSNQVTTNISRKYAAGMKTWNPRDRLSLHLRTDWHRTKTKRNGHKWKQTDGQKRMGTERDGQGRLKTYRDGQSRTETDRDGQRRTETDRVGQTQKITMRRACFIEWWHPLRKNAPFAFNNSESKWIN